MRNAQTTLLRFSNIVGDNFKRAQQSILDVASALGFDLQSAAFAVGRALEQPDQGLRQLRALGIIFSQSQQQVIKDLTETGRVSEAQRVLLDALERSYKGSADAAGKTLSGALAQLKNKFDDIFDLHGDVSFGKIGDSIRHLGDTLTDSKVKQGFQDLLANLLKAVDLLARGAAALPRFGSAIGELVSVKTEGAAKALEDELKQEEATLAKLQTAPLYAPVTQQALKARQEEIDKEKAYIETLKQRIELAKKIEEQNATRVKFPQEAANTAADSIIDQITTGKARDVTDREAIRQREIEAEAAHNKRILEMRESISDLGKTSPVDALSGVSKTLDQTADNIERKLKKIFDPKPIKEFTDTLKEGLENAARSGETTGRGILKNLLAAFESKILFNAIDKLANYFQTQLLSSSAAGGSGGGFWAGLLGALFGHAAGGGQTYGPTIVGEDGPELLLGGGQVMNRRQLAFASSGRGVNVQMGDTNITVQGNADDRVLQAMEIRIQQNNKKQLENMSRILKQNGYGALR